MHGFPRIRWQALSLIATTCNALAVHAATPKLYVNYSASPPLADLASSDICILDADATIDLASVRKPKQTFLAYVSTVEARAGSALDKAARKLEVPAIATNKAWGSQVLDVTNERWEAAVMQTAFAAVAKGFDGLFLDTIDSIQLVAKADATMAARAKNAMVHLIVKLREKFPTAKLVINRGFELLTDVHRHIDGVLVESVYQTASSKVADYHAVSAKDSAWLEQRIRSAQSMGLQVYAVDYVDPSQQELAKQTAQRLIDLGCVPFISTPALDGPGAALATEIPC